MAGSLCTVARWARRRWWAIGLALLLVVVQGWVLVRWKTSAYRAYPGQPGIRRLRWYLECGPWGFLPHLMVPVGTPEARVRARFGPPVLDTSTSSATWTQHLALYRSGGFSLPDPPPTTRVLMYEVASRIDVLQIYYFLTPQGRVAAVFVGET